uniref:Uncharacterized protein n=1 Tax=Oryza punctata TaxID=4537 RepID=A0A0E0JPI0_ORYPU
MSSASGPVICLPTGSLFAAAKEKAQKGGVMLDPPHIHRAIITSARRAVEVDIKTSATGKSTNDDRQV